MMSEKIKENTDDGRENKQYCNMLLPRTPPKTRPNRSLISLENYCNKNIERELILFTKNHGEKSILQFVERKFEMQRNREKGGYDDLPVMELIWGYECCDNVINDTKYTKKIKSLLKSLDKFQFLSANIIKLMIYNYMIHLYILDRKLGKAYNCSLLSLQCVETMAPCIWTAQAYYYYAHVLEVFAYMWPKSRNQLLDKAFDTYQLCREHFIKIYEENPGNDWLNIVLSNAALFLVSVRLQMPTQDLIQYLPHTKTPIHDYGTKCTITYKELKQADEIIKNRQLNPSKQVESLIYVEMRRAQILKGEHRYHLSLASLMRAMLLYNQLHSLMKEWIALDLKTLLVNLYTEVYPKVLYVNLAMLQDESQSYFSNNGNIDEKLNDNNEDQFSNSKYKIATENTMKKNLSENGDSLINLESLEEETFMEFQMLMKLKYKTQCEDNAVYYNRSETSVSELSQQSSYSESDYLSSDVNQ